MKKCEWCDKPFEPTGNAQKFCSKNCARKAFNARMYNKEKVIVCENCGKEFTTFRRKTYCSDECRLMSYGRVKKQRKKEPPKPKLTLAQVNAMARAEGLSYGQYMTKFYM